MIKLIKKLVLCKMLKHRSKAARLVAPQIFTQTITPDSFIAKLYNKRAEMVNNPPHPLIAYHVEYFDSDCREWRPWVVAFFPEQNSAIFPTPEAAYEYIENITRYSDPKIFQLPPVSVLRRAYSSPAGICQLREQRTVLIGGEPK